MSVGDTVVLRTIDGPIVGEITGVVPHQPDWFEITVDSRTFWWPKSQMEATAEESTVEKSNE